MELQQIAHDLKIRLNKLLSTGDEKDRIEAQKIEEQIKQIKYKQQQIKNNIDKMMFDEQESRNLNEKDYQYELRNIYNIDSILKAKPYTNKITTTSPIHEKSILTEIKKYNIEPENKTIETQTDTLLNEIKQMYPSIKKEELKQLIKRYPDLKDALTSSYINQFVKKGDIKNMEDINEVFNINLRHQAKTYNVPVVEKIKIKKEPKNYDYLYLVPNTFKKVF